MNVHELIAELQKFAPDLPVLAEAPYHGHIPVYDVSLASSELSSKRYGVKRGQDALVLWLD